MITKAIRDQLLGHVVAHEGQDSAELTETGLIKMRGGLVIPPASDTSGGDLHTGPADAYTPQERKIMRLDEIEEMRAGGKPAKATRKRVRKDAQPQPEEPKDTSVLVRVVVQGAGEIPSQYAHCYTGSGVLVLGLTKYSYVPAVSGMTQNGLTGLLEFPQHPGGRYVYPGFDFTDADGVRNIVLVKVPEAVPSVQPAGVDAESEEEEEDEYDGQAVQ